MLPESGGCGEVNFTGKHSSPLQKGIGFCSWFFHVSHYLSFVFGDEIQSVVHVVGVEAREYGVVAIAVLAHRGYFRCRAEEPPENQEFGEAADVVLDFGKPRHKKARVFLAKSKFFYSFLKLIILDFSSLT
ncbi:MAG: hypothetical protein LBI54_04740 [Lachnospiraceae bacterium]|jgi:hypothetical protein|nr:hypothetical protein [Lachnospiraceae bacterium]